jgi:hypothetical protein
LRTWGVRRGTAPYEDEKTRIDLKVGHYKSEKGGPFGGVNKLESSAHGES